MSPRVNEERICRIENEQKQMPGHRKNRKLIHCWATICRAAESAELAANAGKKKGIAGDDSGQLRGFTSVARLKPRQRRARRGAQESFFVCELRFPSGFIAVEKCHE